MPSFLLNQIFVFLIVVIGLWLGLWVYFANRKAKINQTFFLMTLSILLWIILTHLASISNQTRLSLFWVRLNFGIVSLFLVTAYFFSVYFPRQERTHRVPDRIVVIIGMVLFFLATFTSLIAQDVVFKKQRIHVVFGDLKILFYGIVVFFAFLVISTLLKKYLKLTRQEKLKTQYFLVGFLIFSLMNLIFNVAFPLWQENVQFYPLGNYSAIFLLGFTAYAIVKRQLFGIKVVLTQLLVGLIAVLLLINIIGSKTPFEYAWKGTLFVAFLVFGYLLIKSIIEEIKRREQLERLTNELKRANIQLEKMDKTKSEFLSIASHQLRTPLTAIKGYISMILEGSYGKISKKSRMPIENIYKSSERLINLVNNLLNISRIEAGKIELEPEKLSLEDIISSVVSELKVEAEKKGLKLIWKRPKFPLPKILIDGDKIRQTISNIIDNAIHYTQKGRVEIKAKKEEAKIKISISDTGIGMTKEEINSLFQSFKRGSAGNRFWTEGAGLGLYVAKKFIEMHKGKIWAESEGKGKGSAFYIELPTILNIDKS